MPRTPRARIRAGSSALHTVQLTLAAIATAETFFAAMIGADVLGAVDAYFGGWLAADIAGECGYVAHCFFGAGCRLKIPRQRCASLSTT